MSELTLFKSAGATLPDYLKEGDSFTKQMAGGSGGKSISIEGGVWRMLVGGEEIAKNEDRAMNFVIVNGNKNVSRSFYEGAYVKGQASTPACYSVDGTTPAKDATNPQSKSCATCPQNIKGSGQGDSRACRFFQRIAVVLEGDMEGTVYRLQLPSKSVFGDAENGKMPFKAYAKFLAGHGVPMAGVVTEARFDTNEAVPVLKFSAVRPLTKAEWEISKTQGATEDATTAIEVTFSSTAQRAAAPALTNAASTAPEPAPAKVAEPAAEPTKRTSKKSEPAPAAKSVDDLMSEWGTDDDE